MNKIYSRWHRYDNNGVKYIVKCEIDKHPEPLEQDGYTIWTRGTGPHNPEALKNVQEGLRRACLGVPKTPEQKEKMRQAKLGKKKSIQTREKMKKAHKLRHEQLRQQQNPVQIYERQMDQASS